MDAATSSVITYYSTALIYFPNRPEPPSRASDGTVQHLSFVFGWVNLFWLRISESPRALPYSSCPSLEWREASGSPNLSADWRYFVTLVGRRFRSTWGTVHSLQFSCPR